MGVRTGASGELLFLSLEATIIDVRSCLIVNILTISTLSTESNLLLELLLSSGPLIHDNRSLLRRRLYQLHIILMDNFVCIRLLILIHCSNFLIQIIILYFFYKVS